MTPPRLATLDRARPWHCAGSSSEVLGRRFKSTANLVAVLLSEYRRAVAASHRYEELRRKDHVALVRIGVASADIAPYILQEFYSDTERAFTR